MEAVGKTLVRGASHLSTAATKPQGKEKLKGERLDHYQEQSFLPPTQTRLLSNSKTCISHSLTRGIGASIADSQPEAMISILPPIPPPWTGATSFLCLHCFPELKSGVSRSLLLLHLLWVLKDS